MPYDASVSPVTLRDHLDHLGIVPVPMATLLAHKKQQVRNHPPHILLTLKPYLLLWFVTSMVFFTSGMMEAPASRIAPMMFAMIKAGGTSTVAIWATGVVIATISRIKVRGVAQWLEWPSQLDDDIPAQVRHVVDYVKDSLPEAKFIYGELIQDDVLLDPYVRVKFNGGTACLGIWENDQVIAVATMPRIG